MVERVFSVGGSVVQDNLDEMGRLAEAFESQGQVVVVTGAGELKKYQDAVSDANNARRDMVGIAATRLNAAALRTAMSDAHPSCPTTPEEILEAAATGRNVVMGGLVPGYSTDAVAATAAELLDAELFIGTTVDGVYTADPRKEDAEKLDEVDVERLLELVKGRNQPGNYALIDETALKLIERSEIPTRIFEGTLENLSSPGTAEATDIVH